MSLDQLVPESFDWTGPYVGAQVGYVWGTDALAETPGAAYSSNFGINGPAGGVFAGYNLQAESVVFGVEAEAEFSQISGTDAGWTFGDTISAKINGQGAVRARLGFAVDKSLVYVAGGLALANIETEYVDGAAVDSYSTLKTGWTIGAGFEQALTETWLARVEYRYSNFGRITDATVNSEPGWSYDNDIATHAIRFGIGAKF